ncbi:PfaD family polyunsaturated fatty acid/polyketide biosynthesis protein, partial [bacterium]|nr:PfaD family polyunsaturated fatty acid/polyketide biosynthesis protein [bacterium]
AGLTKVGKIEPGVNGKAPQFLGVLPAVRLVDLGDEEFRKTYGVKYAYYAGAMANAIASTHLVITLGKAGILGAFGAAGVVPARLESAILEIKAALPNGPYAFNLINSPNEPAMERGAAELYLKHGIRTVEASAYMDVTPSLVYYRAAGLEAGPAGSVVIRNRIIAKLSRKEVASRFLSPAPKDVLERLVADGKITTEQAQLAQFVPMADDITVEADSGGDSDNRPLVLLLPAILALRDELQARYQYAVAPRVGAAGGISTPHAAYAAFAMGAAYVATGSINQACVEAGASEHTRNLLAQAGMADVIMAPAADMFEMGVKVQVLRRGTMFGQRALKLYELYSRYGSIEEIPTDEREKIEKNIFKRELNAIWAETVQFFTERDPRQIERANADPHQKMALIFRWYLGLSSRWSNTGEKGREMDYQIWCGPAMGAFNDWVRGTYLEKAENRTVTDVGLHILTGAAYLTRLRQLAAFGVKTTPALEHYTPAQPL